VTVLTGAEPFTHDGGRVGVLLCHGFTGCPQSLRPWAKALAAHGYTVELPLLPGHGTTWQHLNRTSWPQWYNEVEQAVARLTARCDRVVVAGLSMGGALALRLAEQHGKDIAGLVLVNPAVKIEDPRLAVLPVLRRVLPSLPGIGSDIAKPGVTELAYDRTPLNALASMLELYKLVRADLASITQPVLLFRSVNDHVVPASSSALILASITSTDATEVVLDDSFHVATLDHDAPRIVEGSIAFVERVCASTAESR
jgi:carboxylesterase